MNEITDPVQLPPESEARPELPGIYYENLALSQEVYEQERREPRQGILQDVPKKPLLCCGVLLILLLTAAFFGGKLCDSTANAVTGNGVSLTNREFAIYYWTEYRRCVSEAREQERALPFDPERPLDRQYYDLESGETWQEYFMARALETAVLTQCLCQEAGRNGFVLSEAQQAAFAQKLSAAEQAAASSGFLTAGGQGDLDAYAKMIYGPDATGEDFRQYLFDNALSSAYGAFCYQMQEVTPQEIADYPALSRSELPNVDVRHILLIPEGDDAEAAEAARMQAAELLTQCHSEAEFSALAEQYSRDSGSNRNGGLYENIYPGQMMESFDAWCFDPAGRRSGDTGIVETEYGVHALYFVGYRENYHWMDVVEADLRSEKLARTYAAMLEKYQCHLTPLADVTGPAAGRDIACIERKEQL